MSSCLDVKSFGDLVLCLTDDHVSVLDNEDGALLKSIPLPFRLGGFLNQSACYHPPGHVNSWYLGGSAGSLVCVDVVKGAVTKSLASVANGLAQKLDDLRRDHGITHYPEDFSVQCITGSLADTSVLIVSCSREQVDSREQMGCCGETPSFAGKKEKKKDTHSFLFLVDVTADKILTDITLPSRHQFVASLAVKEESRLKPHQSIEEGECVYI